ncbi:MAG: LEPR-XLL domain-containing protein, partial [Gammaproteobacteria bacterium]
MWDWLKKARPTGCNSDPESLSGNEAGRDSKFRLESLEPRLLLSGDPVLAELARWAENDGSTSDAEELAVIFQEIDQTSAADISAGNGSGEATRAGLTVAWPEGWEVPADKSGISDTAKQIRFADSGPVDLLAVVAELAGQVLDIPATGAIAISAANTSGAADTGTGGRAPQAGTDAAVTHAITSEQLNLVFDTVVEALSASAPDGELAERLGDLTIRLADLAEGVIAEIQGNVILIDITGAGHGWFLDALSEQISAAGDNTRATGAAGDAGTHDATVTAQQLTAELDAQQQQSAGQDRPAAAATSSLLAPPVVETGESSENQQTQSTAEEADAGRGAETGTEAVAEYAHTAQQIQAQPAPLAGMQDSSDSSPTAAANRPVDLLEQVLELVGLATGLQGEAGNGDAASDLVAGLLAASHRLQESNRSTRSELRKDNGKTIAGRETGQNRGAWATESEVSSTAEGGEDAAPRGPPVIEEIQTITEDDVSDTAPAVAAASLLYDEDAPETVTTDTEIPVAPPTDDVQPRAPPAVANMPRAPPLADDSTNELPQHNTAVDADIETAVTSGPSQTTSAQDNQTAIQEDLHQAGADYLLSTGTPDPVSVSSTVLSEPTDPRLAAIVTEAIQRWSDSGLIPAGAVDLSTLTVVVADLAGDALAQAVGTTITIDTDADGFGWFIDTTPSDDSEFNGTAPAGVDLLTVVLHEIGHVLGYPHDAPGLSALMADTLAAGERFLPVFAGEMTLNEVIDALLMIRFDPVNDPNPAGIFEFSSADAAVPDIILVGDAGEFTDIFGEISTFYDLQLEKVTLKFSLMSWNSTNEAWDGQVSIESAVAVLMPGTLDTVIIDDGFETPIRIESAGAVSDNGDGTWSVDFTLKGDQRDGEDILKDEGYDIGAFLSAPFTSGLSVGDEIAILNANQSGFDDLDLADDTQQVLVTVVVYDAATDQTTVTVKYNFNPEANGAWSGGGVIAEADVDIDDDGDTNAVGGTVFLGSSAGIDLLNLNTLEATDLGFPIWLDVRVTRLQLQFEDFRADDTDSTLRLNAELLGINTGSEVTNNLLRSGALGVGLSLEGSVQGIELDMNALRDIRRALSGELSIPSFPIEDVSGITASVSGNFFKLGSIQGGLILKSVMVDNTGAITTVDAPDNRVVTYGAINGAINMLEKRDADGNVIKEGLNFSFNLAISELGPLQMFISLQTSTETVDPKTGKPKTTGIPIGTTGLLLEEVRGGIRFNADIEDLQVRPPFGATEGTVSDTPNAEGQYTVTLTVPGHNLLVGDEFRITAAGNPNYLSGVENFVVTDVGYDENGNPVSF